MRYFTLRNLIVTVGVIVMSGQLCRGAASWNDDPTYLKLVKSLPLKKSLKEKQAVLGEIKAWVKKRESILKPKLNKSKDADQEFLSLTVFENIMSQIPDSRFDLSETTELDCPTIRNRVIYSFSSRDEDAELQMQSKEPKEALQILAVFCPDKTP